MTILVLFTKAATSKREHSRAYNEHEEIIVYLLIVSVATPYRLLKIIGLYLDFIKRR